MTTHEWPCPNCGGAGRLDDLVFRPTGFEVHPGIRCPVCDGKGRVFIASVLEPHVPLKHPVDRAKVF